MAYDLTIHPQTKPIGNIDYQEIDVIVRLNEKYNHWIFKSFLDLYKDQKIEVNRLQEAQLFLLEILCEEVLEEEKTFLYKMISLVSFALHKEKPLFGIAD